MRSLDILVVFRLDFGQIGFNLVEKAFATWKFALLATNIVFYNILARACTEIKILRNFALSFHSTFWAFLCISQAPFGQLLWSGHHWKDLFLLQKLSIDDANFGQKGLRQKWKKDQGSSRPVTGGTGVNGLTGLSKLGTLTYSWISLYHDKIRYLLLNILACGFCNMILLSWHYHVTDPN